MASNNVRKTGFVKLPNSVVDDNRLSLAAKGLLAYFLSHKKGFKPRMKDIENRCSEGEKRVRTVLTELRSKGFVLREDEENLFDPTYQASTKPVQEWVKIYHVQAERDKKKGRPKETPSKGSHKGVSLQECPLPSALEGHSREGTYKKNILCNPENNSIEQPENNNNATLLPALADATPPSATLENNRQVEEVSKEEIPTANQQPETTNSSNSEALFEPKLFKVKLSEMLTDEHKYLTLQGHFSDAEFWVNQEVYDSMTKAFRTFRTKWNYENLMGDYRVGMLIPHNGVEKRLMATADIQEGQGKGSYIWLEDGTQLKGGDLIPGRDISYYAYCYSYNGKVLPFVA